ncbi:hypothetical protein B296_00035619 [Ensete ventricosum]|uniref:CCHC-type domain-containing protein n=1 Tax=Ensete ventricosum TaxID=4639 RepID=A0A427A539_ENSVE|nr:hypothetical protein B296_00035619 [Ensete ventricosum]
MGDIRGGSDSTEPCTENIINKDSGVGANAASTAEIVFITNSPLSELIWIPQEGLSLKYTDSSKAEKKASFLWKAESCNMRISTSPCTNRGESGCSRDQIAGELSTVQSNHNADKNADGIAFLCSRKGSVDPQPISLSSLHEQDPRSCGGKKPEKSMNDADINLSQSVKNGVDPCSPGSDGCLHAICPATDANNLLNEIFSPGPRPDLAETEAGFAITAGNSNVLLNIPNFQKSGLVGVSNSHDSMPTKCGTSISSKRSSECKPTDLDFRDTQEDDIRKTNNLVSFQLHGSQHSYGRQSESVGRQSKDGLVVASLFQEAGKDETQNINFKNVKTDKFRSKSDVNPGKLEKGKKKILFDDEDYDSSLKEKADSNESVESSNGQRLISNGKRAFSFDFKTSEGCKRIKRESNENSCTGSLIRNDSSFINWISTITSSFSGYDQTTTSLALLPQSYHSMKESFGLLRMSHEKIGGAMCKTLGFNTFFQALYCPNMIVPNTTSDDHQREGGKQTHTDLKEHLTNKPLSVSSPRIVCGGGSGKSQSRVSPLNERHNQAIYHVENVPSTMINVSSSNSQIHEELEKNRGQTRAFNSMNTSNSSARKGLICAEEKGYGRLSSHPKSPVSMMCREKSSYLENLWITRFLPKVSSPLLRSEKCNLSINDHGAFDKEEKFPEKCVSSYLKSQRESAGEVSRHPVNPTFSCGLKRLDNQMLKPRVSSIIPSENFKNTDMAASFSAKRFDLNPSKVSRNRNLSCTPITCLFCGTNGHSLRECSELADFGLQDVKEFLDSYDGKDISSRLCIQCFQVNHWAISCPHVSLETKNTSNSSFSVAHESCNVTEGKHDSQVNLWSRDKNKQHANKSKLPEREDSRMDAQTVNYRSICADRVASPTAKVLKDYRATNMVNMDQQASCSSKNESRKNRITPFYRSIATDVSNEKNGIFKAIRRLRLSRADVIRWMKSANLSYSLEGFFIRLRLGKWEKGLGGTRYQVARIISKILPTYSIFPGKKQFKYSAYMTPNIGRTCWLHKLIFL